MDTKEFEEVQKIRQLLERIAASSALESSKTMFEIGRAYSQTGQWAMSLATLEAVSSFGNPLYSANALLLIAEIHRKLRNTAKEIEVERRIVSLPHEIKQFIDPLNLGVMHAKLGELDKAKECYDYAAEFSPGNPGLQANLAELFLLRREFHEGLALAETLQSRPEVNSFLIGRMFKGLCLWFLNRREEAAQEFRWIAQYLLNAGGVPLDFAWDFRDLQPLVDGLGLRSIELIVHALDRKMSLDEFRARWQEIEPPPQQGPGAGG